MTLRYVWGTQAPKRSGIFGARAGCVGLGRARWCAPVALSAVAWIWGCNTERRDPDSKAPAPEANAPEANAVDTAARPLQPAPGTAPADPSGAGGASSSIGDRPSVEDNMGRGFQGVLALRLVAPEKSHALRYQSRGNSARLQLDPLGREPKAAGSHLDALIWDQNISLLSHHDRTVRTLALDRVKPRDDRGDGVKLDKTGERTTLLGVGCEHYEISDGPLRVSACVAALPGTFDVDKFETVSGIDVPAWVEELMRDELLPVKGSARDAAGRELYTFELTEYTPGPVDASQLVLPQNYAVVSAAPSASE